MAASKPPKSFAEMVHFFSVIFDALRNLFDLLRIQSLKKAGRDERDLEIASEEARKRERLHEIEHELDSIARRPDDVAASAGRLRDGGF
jgi:hypothetical protein